MALKLSLQTWRYPCDRRFWGRDDGNCSPATLLGHRFCTSFLLPPCHQERKQQFSRIKTGIESGCWQQEMWPSFHGARRSPAPSPWRIQSQPRLFPEELSALRQTAASAYIQEKTRGSSSYSRRLPSPHDLFRWSNITLGVVPEFSVQSRVKTKRDT